jgi:D-amino peptidase
VKIYMLWDMEGTSGLFTKDQAWYWHEGVPPEVKEAGLRLLMADVAAATAAALDAGADEVIVCDTHHGGGNLRIPEMRLHPRITYYGRSRAPAPERQRGRWMPGLDESVHGFMRPGHHAKAGTPDAFLPHTSNLDWLDFRINGQSVGEIGLEACYAAHFGAPLILVQGDEAACQEAEAQFPGVVTAPVKRAVDQWTATGLDAAAARRLTAEKVAEAVTKLRRGDAPAPFQTALPMAVAVRLATVQAADRIAQRPGVRRVDDHTVEGVVPRRADVLAWLTGDGLRDGLRDGPQP